jgi:NAD(P)H-hydrate epimerase
MSAVRELARRTGAVVVLKGARTCICDGRSGGDVVLICGAGGPELATAGTGDVLAGMLVALLAQGWDAAMAATVATYWHGVAGSVAKATLGGSGVIASDVVAAIPAAHAQLLASD